MSFMNFGPRTIRAGGFAFKSTPQLGIQVLNETGSDIAVDKLVAISGYDVTTNLPNVVLADADNLAHYDVWVTKSAIVNGTAGTVYKGGMSVANLNTNSATTVGDPVYLSATAGGFAHTAPTSGVIIPVGYVYVKSATVGQIRWDMSFGRNSNASGFGSAAGQLVVKTVALVEAGASGLTHTATVPVPAGSWVHDIRLTSSVLWNGTSATGKVGDTADDDGYFTGINMKATDLAVGEVLSTAHSTLWGGKEGVYLVAATGVRGPVTSNFGMYYAAGSNITCIVVSGAADGTAGRSFFSVMYSQGGALTMTQA